MIDDHGEGDLEVLGVAGRSFGFLNRVGSGGEALDLDQAGRISRSEHLGVFLIIDERPRAVPILREELVILLDDELRAGQSVLVGADTDLLELEAVGLGFGLARTAGAAVGGDRSLVVHAAVQVCQRILGHGASVRHDDSLASQGLHVVELDDRRSTGLGVTGLCQRVQLALHILAVDLHLEGGRGGDLQALGRGIGDGERVFVVVGRGSGNGCGHGEVHGVAHVHGLAVHVHLADFGGLVRRGERVLVLRVELTHGRDVALAGHIIGHNRQVGQPVDGGGHNGRRAGLTIIGVSHQVPALAVHRDRQGLARLALVHGQTRAIGVRQRIGLGQFRGELADLLRIELRHVRGRIVGVFRRNTVLFVIVGGISGLGHGLLPCRNRFHFNRIFADVRERGELVWRVRVVGLRIVDLQQRIGRLRVVIGLCADCAQGHATEQRRSGGDAGEKFPHLHENPLFLIV